jgi:hypothetical protein
MERAWLTGRPPECSPQEPGQILAVQQLHDNEHPPVMLTYVEDVGDPRMTESGRTLRFPGKLSRFVWVRSSGQQYLDGNLTADAQVAAAPYLARSAAPQQAFKAVPARQLGPGLHELAHFHLAAPAEAARNGIVTPTAWGSGRHPSACAIAWPWRITPFRRIQALQKLK